MQRASGSTRVRRAAIPAGLLLLLSCPLRGDDGASSISAGGLVAVREPRVTMAKEVLSISLKRVVVDYDFRNDTDAPVTTEVAFPIPPYGNEMDGADPARAGFDDFKLAVNGKPIPFQTEVKALVKGRDITDLLRKDGVSIADFGHYDSARTQESRDFKKLSAVQVRELLAAGAIHQEGGTTDATWEVQKRYHWTQTFPAHGTVHIRHQYSPVAGAQLVPPELLAAGRKVAPDEKYAAETLRSMCVSPAQMRAAAALKGMVSTEWVDFILTTANSWKRPIGDFTLIVERTDPRDTVSFCWDGPVTKLDANHFQAHTTNLVPGTELHIGFYTLARAE